MYFWFQQVCQSLSLSVHIAATNIVHVVKFIQVRSVNFIPKNITLKDLKTNTISVKTSKEYISRDVQRNISDKVKCKGIVTKWLVKTNTVSLTRNTQQKT